MSLIRKIGRSFRSVITLLFASPNALMTSCALWLQSPHSSCSRTLCGISISY